MGRKAVFTVPWRTRSSKGSPNAARCVRTSVAYTAEEPNCSSGGSSTATHDGTPTQLLRLDVRAGLARHDVLHGLSDVGFGQIPQPPDGMTAIDLSDGRRVFAPVGSCRRSAARPSAGQKTFGNPTDARPIQLVVGVEMRRRRDQAVFVINTMPL